MYIIKVDIQTGEVHENRLREYWAREPLHRPKKPAPPAPAPRSHSGKDRDLMARVKAFRSRVRKLSNSWEEDELYHLAVLVGREKMSYKQAANHLARSPDACKYMYRRLKKAGVI